MLLGNVDLYGTDTELQMAPESFDGVSVGVAVHVFLGAVVDAMAFLSDGIQTVVNAEIVGDNTGFFQLHMMPDDGDQGCALAVIHSLQTDLALAFHHAKNRSLGFRSTSARLEKS